MGAYFLARTLLELIIIIRIVIVVLHGRLGLGSGRLALLLGAWLFRLGVVVSGVLAVDIIIVVFNL